MPVSRLARLGGIAFRRRRLVLGAWVGALVAAFALAASFGGTFSADYNTPGSDSKAAADALAERFPATSPDTIDVVWRTADGTPTAFLREASSLPGLAAASEPQVSPDGAVAVARIPLTMLPDEVPRATGERLLELGGAANVELGGSVIQQAQQGPISSEIIGLSVAFLILLIALGTVVAAGLPLILALFGLGIASALIILLAAVLPTPDWSSTVAAMLGIGVGIDYALLILTRYRAAGGGEVAIREAVATAGRSVLIAGLTVVISLLGLFAMGLTYLYGVALAAIIAVLVVMVASITLLPALLGFAGPRIERLKLPGRRSSNGALAGRWSQAVQRRPWTAAIAGALVLLALASPVTGLRLGFPDAGNDRAETTTRQAFDLMTAHFGAGSNGPFVVVAPTAAAAGVAATLQGEAGIASVAPPQVNPAGDTALILANPKTSPEAQATEDLLAQLRDGRLGEDVVIGGRTAQAVDQAQTTAARLPLFIGGVVGLSLLLLLVAFRSVTVALKAAALNLFSVAAAYGVVALLAQGGFFGQLVGIDTATPVPPFIPVIMFATLFGLSMDYEVFLLSRVREAWLGGRSTSGAVTEGLTRTAGVISAAAAIMVVVFGALALSPEVFLKLIGIGLATAVLVDATIVRLVMVPAVMQLLGERNWWMPRWLDRLVPHTELEAPALSRA
ncbi:MMPL family transporter [Solirubrobacter taibaiensis]|nr:MMPL family transporter [Solirubrobacter taibaiensis]